MKRAIILILLLTGCSGYNLKINGVNPKSFKNKSLTKIIIGSIMSLAVHEGGHLLYAELNGGGHFDFDNFAVISEDYYNNSYSEQQMFHRAGFLGQLFVGGILTAIPETRYSDFTFGFNTFTTLNTAIYTITGGNRSEYSDIKQLDNGKFEGVVYTGVAGTLTYINIGEENGQKN